MIVSLCKCKKKNKKKGCIAIQYYYYYYYYRTMINNNNKRFMQVLFLLFISYTKWCYKSFLIKYKWMNISDKLKKMCVCVREREKKWNITMLLRNFPFGLLVWFGFFFLLPVLLIYVFVRLFVCLFKNSNSTNRIKVQNFLTLCTFICNIQRNTEYICL